MKFREKVDTAPKNPARFIPVCDGSRKRVRGLWRRGTRYYLQVKLSGERSPRRVPLLAETLTAAKQEMERKRVEFRDGKALPRGRKPMFADYADGYIALLENAAQSSKRPATIAGERQSLDKWKQHLGPVRLDKITPAMIASYRDQRLVAGLSPRTVNLAVQHLRNVLARAVDDGLLLVNPVDRIKRLPHKPPKRPLLTMTQFEQLCAAALSACARNGQELHDYLRFLAYSGAREKEALRVRWQDVDFERRTLVIGADGLSKNGEQRTVDLNPALEAHLRACWQRRDPGVLLPFSHVREEETATSPQRHCANRFVLLVAPPSWKHSQSIRPARNVGSRKKTKGWASMTASTFLRRCASWQASHSCK